jgi:hypothetical protein
LRLSNRGELLGIPQEEVQVDQLVKVDLLVVPSSVELLPFFKQLFFPLLDVLKKIEEQVVIQQPKQLSS